MKPISRKRSQYWQLFIFLILCCLTLIAGDERGLVRSIREFIEIQIINRRVDHTENNAEKIANLESKVISLEQIKTELTDENIDLRKQLGSPLPPEMTFIPGYVISLAITKNDALLKVAVGEADGVKKGMPVVSESILVGTVIDVTPKIATILLISSKDSKVAVKTSSGAHGLVVGTDEKERPGTALIDRVLQTETLQSGDKITTSGEDELPPNLLVGEVNSLRSEAREPFQKASVSLFINPGILKRIFIVSNY